jgi:hypothetical protein
VADHGLCCRVVRCGIRNALTGVSGSQSYLQQLAGLSPEALATEARRLSVAAATVKPGEAAEAGHEVLLWNALSGSGE